MAFSELVKSISNLSHTEKSLSDYIENHPEDVLKSNAKKLALAAHVSVSTVYRLLEKLELEGMEDLKVLLAKQSTYNPSHLTDYNLPFSKDNSPFEIMKILEEVYASTIASTMDALKLKDLHQASSAIDQADQTLILTSLENQPSALEFSHKMKRIQKDVRVYSSLFDLEMEIPLAQKRKTVFIILSYSGKVFELERFIESIVKVKDKLIVVSSYNDKLFRPHGDIHLPLCSKENAYRGSITRFAMPISSLYIFDLLFCLIYWRHYEQYANHPDEVYESIQSIYKD